MAKETMTLMIEINSFIKTLIFWHYSGLHVVLSVPLDAFSGFLS